MPFTPAHAAIVLPFLRAKTERVSATALVIGSLSPDFEYFFKMSVNSVHSHTLWGIFYFDIPVVIFLSFAFHLVIKKNLIANLPIFLQRRVYKIRDFDFLSYFRNHVLVFVLSAGVGALTHIGWDAFTHNSGFFAQRISFYKHVFIPFDGVNYPLFYFLQQLSTVVGLLAIALYIYFTRPDASVPTEKPNLYYWLWIIILTTIAIGLRFYLIPNTFTLGNFVVSTITAMLIAVSVCGFIQFTPKRFT